VLKGDRRVQEQPMLGSMHVMFFREHNRIAREIKKLSPALNDATLYLVILFKSSKFSFGKNQLSKSYLKIKLELVIDVLNYDLSIIL
jgi:hypothetical protein